MMKNQRYSRALRLVAASSLLCSAAALGLVLLVLPRAGAFTTTTSNNFASSTQFIGTYDAASIAGGIGFHSPPPLHHHQPQWKQSMRRRSNVQVSMLGGVASLWRGHRNVSGNELEAATAVVQRPSKRRSLTKVRE